MDKNILEIFFPTGLLDFFEVVSYDINESQYSFQLEEKNIVPEGYEKTSLESKGFYEGGLISDFPLRGKRCVYRIRRRKWIVKEEGTVITRDWNIVANGTRITEEFASFLKELNR